MILFSRESHLRLAAVASLVAAALTLSAATAEGLGRSTVTGRVAATSTPQGAANTVAGTVTRGGTARTVSLQRSIGHEWRSTVSVRTSSGRYSLRIPTSTVGRFTYRLYAPAAGGRAAAATGSFTVTVVPTPRSNPKAYAFLSRTGNASAPIARWNPCTDTGQVDHHAIGYRVNPTGAPAGGLADVAGALARISAASGLKFANRGSTTLIPGAPDQAAYPADTQLVLAWARPGQSSYLPAKAGSKTLAVGGASWFTGYRDTAGRPAWAINRGFVVLDATRSLTGGFGSGPASGLQGTRGQLLMHELGHAVGLDHPKVTDPTEIMSPVMSRKPAAWGAGDRTALELLGTASGCLHRG
jgi:hypothetical protein